MCNFKLLLVDDDEQELKNCQDCIRDFQNDNSCLIDLVGCKSVEDALKKLDNTYDGAIIDLKLGKDGDEGKKVISQITESNFRIPIAILTATPGSVDDDESYIGVFKKGEEDAGYSNLLKQFRDVYNTGLTRIMGGRGKIEDTLHQVFQNNLIPKKYIKTWIEYGKKNPSQTEKALLRYTLNHLLQLLEDDDDCCFPEEVYMTPPCTSKIRTGSIVIDKTSKQYFVVMNPACDLVIRNDRRKTDQILMVDIERIIEKDGWKIYPGPRQHVHNSGHKKNIEKAFKNNISNYYHWLPGTEFFDGGFLNFRKISTLDQEDYYKSFELLSIQISPAFVKDIVARFSSYYARQGQPDIDIENFIPTTNYVEESQY